MNEHSRGVVIGAVASIAGAALGVVGALFATALQRADALEAEERARRSEVYSNYREKTWSYLSAQINLLEDPDNCRGSMTRPDDGREVCLQWDSSPLEDPRSEYITARDDLAIFGTADVLDAAEGLNNVVGAVGGVDPRFGARLQCAFALR